MSPRPAPIEIRHDEDGIAYVPIGAVAQLLQKSTHYVARLCRAREIPAWREYLGLGRRGRPRRSQWRINAEWAAPLLEAHEHEQTVPHALVNTDRAA